MASPNETKLPEQQISHSDPATPPTPTAAEFPSAEIAEDQAQEEEEMAVLMTTVTLASGVDDHHSEQAQGEPNQVALDTAVTGMADGGVESQQQPATEAAANAPVPETPTAPGELASDEGGDLHSDDEGSDMTFEDGIEPDSEDEDPFDPNQAEVADGLDGILEPITPTGEANPEIGLENETFIGFANEEGHTSNILESQEGSTSNAGRRQDTSIANDLGNYGDIPSIVDGREIVDYAETVSEAGAWDDEGGHVAEAISNPEADQAFSVAPAESAHVEGEDSGSVKDTSPDSDHDEAVNTARPGSDIEDGDDNVSTTPAATSSEHGDGEIRGSMTPASTGSDHGHEERSGPATPALTFSQYSEKDKEPGSGYENEEHGSLVAATPGGGHEDEELSSSVAITPAGSSHEDEEHGSSVATTPDGSKHGNEENMESVTTTSAGPDDGNEESSGSMAPAPAGSDHGNTEGSGSPTATPANVDEAYEENSDTVSSKAAPEEDIPSPSQEEKGKMKEVRDEELPKDSSAPMEETPSDTSDEGEVPDPTAPPAQDAEEAVSQAGAEADHEHEVIDLLPPEMPDPPLEPTQPLGEDVLAYDIEEGEVTVNPVDRVSILTGYQRPEVEALAAEEEEQRRTLEALHNRRDDSEGTEDPADTALGANADDNIEGHSGESSEDVGSGDSDQGAFQDLVVRTCKDSDQDSDTVHLKVEYRVQYSNCAKATMCISIPVTITHPALKQMILSALRQHGEFENPRPAHKEAKIARLVAVFAKKKDEEPGFCRTIELTDENLEETLRLMPKRSIYDVVKVQFEPGTNGEARPRKATGKVYGKSRKVGGL